MMNKDNLDMDKIAKGLGGKCKGKVKVSGGYFGAMQLAADMDRSSPCMTCEHRGNDGCILAIDKYYECILQRWKYRVELT